MSARSASEVADAELASCRQVRVPGTARTYEVRDQLRALGLRWDPATHAWHGAIRAGDELVLERELRVRAHVVHPIEASVAAAAPSPPSPPSLPRLPRVALPDRPIRHDGSRTSFEARIAFPRTMEHDEDAIYDGRFTYWDVTSGLADEDRDLFEDHGCFV